MNQELDDKQKKLIGAWLGRGLAEGEDEYGRFMAAWLAFNALCYAHFGKSAVRPRADLGKARGLDSIQGKVNASGTIEVSSSGAVKLDIRDPDKILIVIKAKYTEDLVFGRFSEKYGAKFKGWLQDSGMRSARDGFLDSIRRNEIDCYVVNMLRVEEYDARVVVSALRDRGIIRLVDDADDLGQLVGALYQVRCNVFHGEKTPGEVNDDRIVKAARPLVCELVQRALA